MKFKQYDENSPGFIGRERKRLAVIEAGKKFADSNKLVDQVSFFDAMVDFVCEYVDASKEEVENLSRSRLIALHNKITSRLTGADPKGSDSSESTSKDGKA